MSEKQYCVDVFTDRKMPWMEEFHPIRAASRYGTYYTFRADERTKKRIMRKAMWRGIRTRAYESRWARSADYRSLFLSENEPPYRCIYCGRYISSDEMQVDHIVPVAAVKKSAFARWLLERKDIHSVNDIRNLAPSCRRCNMKKGTKLGLWYIRACLHRNPEWETIKGGILFWIFFLVAVVLGVAACIGF